MTEFKKTELNAIISDKLIQAIKTRILRNCMGYEGIKKADIFRNYINSLNRDETMFLWDTIKALGWTDFINCMNDSLEEF
jgi:hypothetical protein